MQSNVRWAGNCEKKLNVRLLDVEIKGMVVQGGMNPTNKRAIPRVIPFYSEI